MGSFLTAQISRRGGRHDNEDSHSVVQSQGMTCWVLADGLGGHGSGEVASHIACAAVIEAFEASPNVTRDAMTQYLVDADRVLRAEQDRRDLLTMRTTLVVLVANSTHAIWGHIGDSRLYHLRGGRIVSQTQDHSLPQKLVEAGEITAAQIRHHEDRNRLLRVVGEEAAAEPTVLPEPVALQPGDAFLLCSDGFWENVNELEMELDFAKSIDPADWLPLMETRLQERVDGSHDNYTAIAVFAEGMVAQPQTAPIPVAPPLRSERSLEWAVVIMAAVLLVLAALLLFPRLIHSATTRTIVFQHAQEPGR